MTGQRGSPLPGHALRNAPTPCYVFTDVATETFTLRSPGRAHDTSVETGQGVEGVKLAPGSPYTHVRAPICTLP